MLTIFPRGDQSLQSCADADQATRPVSGRQGTAVTGAGEKPSHTQIVARLSQAQKSNRGAPLYSRWVNRPLGRQFAAIAYRLGLTPNTVSWISAALTSAAIVAVALVHPSPVSALAITLALVIGYALDSADGQVARLRGGGSPSGEWLDHVLDSLKIASFHLAIAIMWFRFYDLSHPSLLLIPLGFSVVACVFFFALTLSDMLRRIADAKGGGQGLPTASVNRDEAAPVLRSLIVLPNDYGLLCLVMILIFAHTAFMIVYAALLAANILLLGAGSLRWFREMSHLGRPRPSAL
jgi:phosphatidylglycerophosphate synthase